MYHANMELSDVYIESIIYGMKLITMRCFQILQCCMIDFLFMYNFYCENIDSNSYEVCMYYYSFADVLCYYQGLRMCLFFFSFSFCLELCICLHIYVHLVMQIDLTILCAVDTVDKLSVTNVLAYIYVYI